MDPIAKRHEEGVDQDARPACQGWAQRARHALRHGLELPEEWHRLSPAARRRFLRESFQAYTFLLPALVIIGVFHVFAIFYAVYISLHDWSILKEAYIGLANYSKLLADPEFRQSLLVTLWYVIGTVPVGLALSLGVAVLLFRPLRGVGFYRTLFFLPYITSLVAAAAVWQWMYNPDYGVLNLALARLGLPAQQWLLEPRGVFGLALAPLGISLPEWAAGPSLALVSIIVMSIWSGLGFNVIVYLAGLGSIPRELQEAARVDGAGEWQVFRQVTVPLLSPTTFFLVIIATIRAFQAFNQIYVMSPNDPTTRTLTMFIFQTFYGSSRAGYGAAAAMALFVILLLLTIAQMRLGQEKVHYG
ncbi:MAG TPA: sugar ABC transporter permease [Armatimonadetes bacterium]|nr:sugar ABC transporter permease [Armatimonadota bacterium]